MDQLPLQSLGIAAAEVAAARELALRRPYSIDMETTVVGAVARHARSRPGSPAVIGSGGVILTYRGLADRVGRIADILREYECVAGDLVAVLGRRSADTPARFLALETLDLVYVPLDADWPDVRIAEIIQRCRPKAVLLDADASSEVFDDIDGLTLIRLPHDGGAGAVEPSSPVNTRDRCADPSRVSYVIHTSGTTGTPKGAAVEHRGMINHLWAKVLDLGLTSEDVVAFSAPLVFDISVWQMLAPLLAGGSVAVVADSEVRFPKRLLTAVRERGVTVAEFVPTVLGWLLEAAGDGEAPPRLRWLISTGEELQPALADRVLKELPYVSLMNAYGPTECSDDVTHYVVPSAGTGSSRVPVGTPVVNAAIYVLTQGCDGSWRSVPEGESGELFVGGVVVGPGYIDNQEATARAFFRDDLDPVSPTGRIYRTGDAAMIKHGLVHYLGRLDRQVKVSGVRMELGEIEAALSRHHSVRECAVVLDRSAADDALAAFYVSGGVAVSRGDLIGWLSGILPRELVPGSFVEMPALPLTANGKVDHTELERVCLDGRVGRPANSGH